MHIIFDIGGTKMRLAGVRDTEEFFDIKKEPTPSDNFEEGMACFYRLAREIAGEQTIERIAGGVAGPLSKDRSMLLNAPNIKGWIGKPLKKELEKMFHVPVLIENDADVVGLGEAMYGSGRGFDIVSYMTVSTGVGGGRIIRGRIDESAQGFEPGHHIIEVKGEMCPGCGGSGDLESLVSGTALTRKTGKDPRDIPQDDPVWDEIAKLLAVGVNNVAVFWSSDVIVLGGSMIVGDPAISLEKVEEHFKKVMTIFPECPPLRKAELKDEGGLYGAMALCRPQ